MPPVVIGGVGGSGTRVIANCLNALGFYMGNDLNESSDNLWFTLLFKRPEILHCPDREFEELASIFLKGMTGHDHLTPVQVKLISELAEKDRQQHPADWLQERVATLITGSPTLDEGTRWGWKEPNSHIVLDRLLPQFGNMKYIHVARNGLDMAHSNNQNQLHFWGNNFFPQGFEVTPRYSLAYWCMTHKRVIGIGKTMGNNFLFLNFDALCQNPAKELATLCRFLNVDDSYFTLDDLAKNITAPSSIGRFKQFGTDIFEAKDVSFVREIGFDVNCQPLS